MSGIWRGRRSEPLDLLGCGLTSSRDFRDLASTSVGSARSAPGRTRAFSGPRAGTKWPGPGADVRKP
jgi:hypothetical protein